MAAPAHGTAAGSRWCRDVTLAVAEATCQYRIGAGAGEGARQSAGDATPGEIVRPTIARRKEGEA